MKRVLLTAAVLAAFPALAADPPVGIEALAGVDHLWRYSGKAKTAMSSSTDPSSGNMDMSNFHGKHRGEKILANIEGPGCVYRVWSAYPSGRIKFYLDGDKEPALSCSFKKFLEGECKDLPKEFSVGRTAYYLPVCFEESIVITAPGFHFPGYYQVSYQTYDRGVRVESFDADQVSAQPRLEEALELWKSGPLARAKDLAWRKATVEPGRGKCATAVRLSGPAIIRRLSLKNPGDPADPLPAIRLRIRFDGEDIPSVDLPADAFFMNRFDLKDHWPAGRLENMFVSAGPDGYSCSFPMPFAKSAEIELCNPGDKKRVEVEVRAEEKDALPDNAMRFKAEYREKDYDTEMSEDAVITFDTPVDPDTNYLALERDGRGHYLGCALFVESVGAMWWGEGDEMTYIDGAGEPQIRGTGTEDEFNWSWGFKPHMSPVSGTLPVVPPCDEPLAAQLIPSLRNPECAYITGHNVSYRLRPSDYVPFDQSIKVSYEILGSSQIAPNSFITGNLSQLRGDDYSSVTYWYEMP